MTRQIIDTTKAAKSPPAYSQAVKAGGFVFVSGTGPFSAADGTIVGTTIQEQCSQCLRNVTAILEAAGTSLDNVVSATVILLNADDFAGMNEEWIKWFPANPPARQGALLPARIPGMKVSVAVIAEVDGERPVRHDDG
jgi:2-iminobutanoate/2-iminopropanoate deaminase